MSDSITIHALRHGFPLCGFTTAPPNEWPTGHFWVSWLEWEAAIASRQWKAKELCVKCVEHLDREPSWRRT